MTVALVDMISILIQVAIFGLAVGFLMGMAYGKSDK